MLTSLRSLIAFALSDTIDDFVDADRADVCNVISSTDVKFSARPLETELAASVFLSFLTKESVGSVTVFVVGFCALTATTCSTSSSFFSSVLGVNFENGSSIEDVATVVGIILSVTLVSVIVDDGIDVRGGKIVVVDVNSMLSLVVETPIALPNVGAAAVDEVLSLSDASELIPDEILKKECRMR